MASCEIRRRGRATLKRSRKLRTASILGLGALGSQAFLAPELPRQVDRHPGGPGVDGVKPSLSGSSRLLTPCALVSLALGAAAAGRDGKRQKGPGIESSVDRRTGTQRIATPDQTSSRDQGSGSAVALQPDVDVERRSLSEFVPKIQALKKKAENLQKKDLKQLVAKE
eukprot:s1270_g35.t1